MNHITIGNVKIEKTCELSPMANAARKFDSTVLLRRRVG